MNRQWLIKELIFNHTALKKSFPLRVSSVIVTKSAVFFVQCQNVEASQNSNTKWLKEDVEFMKKELNSRDELINFLIYT